MENLRDTGTARHCVCNKFCIKKLLNNCKYLNHLIAHIDHYLYLSVIDNQSVTNSRRSLTIRYYYTIIIVKYLIVSNIVHKEILNIVNRFC